MPAVARKGDTGSGCGGSGVITGSASKTTVDGKLVARVGDQYTCSLHLVQSITTGSSKYKCEGKVTAVVGSLTSCGATINTGSGTTSAPLDAPPV